MRDMALGRWHGVASTHVPRTRQRVDGGTRWLKSVGGDSDRRGSRGARGPRGSPGVRGPVGPRGPQGMRGLQGPQGPEGQRGSHARYIQEVLSAVISEHREMVARLRREIAVSRVLQADLRGEMNKLLAEVRHFRSHT